MIELKLEPYCDGCGDFEPELHRNEFRSVAGGHRYFDTKVMCEHREKCRRIAKLIGHEEKEKESDKE